MKRYAINAETFLSIANNLIRWGAICFIAYLVFRCIETLAGKTTFADIGIDFLADVKISVLLSLCAGAGGVAYGYKQRQLRKSTVELLHKRINELETEVDSSRSSSNLTARGDSNPRDVI